MNVVYHGIMKTMRVLVTLILMAIVIIVTLQVFFRYVLAMPIGWSEQICRLLFLWGIMLGIPVTFYEKSELVFDILLMKFPSKLQFVLNVCYAVLGIAFCVFYFVASMELVTFTGARLTPGVVMPYNVLYGAQPVCAVLMGLVFIERTVAILKKGKEKEGAAE